MIRLGGHFDSLVNPRLEVRVDDVDEYTFLSESRCRRVYDASPLHNDVYTYVPVGV